MSTLFVKHELYFNTQNTLLYECIECPAAILQTGSFDVRLKSYNTESSIPSTWRINVKDKNQFVHVRFMTPNVGDEVIIIEFSQMKGVIRKGDTAQRFGAKPGTIATVMNCSLTPKGQCAGHLKMLKFNERYVFKGQKRTYDTDNYFVSDKAFVTIINHADSSWSDVKVSKQAEEILTDMFADTPDAILTTAGGPIAINTNVVSNISHHFVSPYKIVASSMYGKLDDDNFSIKEIAETIKVNKKKAILLL